MSRLRALFLAVLCVLCGVIGNRWANTYPGRLPEHAGYYLVAASDQIQPQDLTPGARPRHTVLVVIDGLRADYARAMQSVRRLRATGQCRQTTVGAVTVSRPVYAVISTGLEQDRTGSRNNDDTSPLHVESIWQVARRSGLRVTAVSELPWFQQLFPDGFDDYRLVSRAQDHFTTSAAELGDLALVHPIYVDENGHEHGGRSSQYAAAAARADQELGRLLDRLDLNRDLVVFTADHGHTDRGGHGSASPEVGQVLTCFSGHGVRRLQQPELAGPAELFDSRAIAPALAVLLQLRFPQNLRADQDTLDSIWSLVDPSVYPAPYLADRHAAVEHFRAVNRAVIGHWLGRSGNGDWSELYAHGYHWQLGRGLLFLLPLCCILVLVCPQVLPRHPIFFGFWAIGTAALLGLLYTAARGSFDFNSVNSRPEFVRWASITSVMSGLCALGIYFWRWRDPAALAVAQVQLVILALILNVAHIIAFGWPLGFPLPGRVLIFFPFIGNAFLAWESVLAGLTCLVLALYPAASRAPAKFPQAGAVLR